jgi:hypothetical protein
MESDSGRAEALPQASDEVLESHHLIVDQFLGGLVRALARRGNQGADEPEQRSGERG